MRSGALISWIALLSLAGTVAADDNSEVLRETLSALLVPGNHSDPS